MDESTQSLAQIISSDDNQQNYNRNLLELPYELRRVLPPRLEHQSRRIEHQHGLHFSKPDKGRRYSAEEIKEEEERLRAAGYLDPPTRKTKRKPPNGTDYNF